MTFSDQQARIRLEKNGNTTVVHLGSTYPHDKVKFSNVAEDYLLREFPRDEYQDATISGARDSQKDELTILSIELC